MISLVWPLVFFGALFVVVKSAGKFIDAASDISRKAGVSEWLIGITLVSIGTSLPELTTSLFSIIAGEAPLVADNIVGSSVANILLVIGISAIVARTIIIKRDLIDIDMPLLALTQIFLIFTLLDKTMSFYEGILSLALYAIYLGYGAHLHNAEGQQAIKVKKTYLRLTGEIIAALAVLLVSAHYTVQGLLGSASALGIQTSLLAVTALAIGTSLPELVVSAVAAARKQYELSIGNIVGSNILNGAGIMGILALIRPLPVSEPTYAIGIPFLIAATFACILSSVSKKIHSWEGMMYIVLYVLFVTQLFA